MSKKLKHNLMRKWPEDDSCLPVVELLPPLKKIILDGYELKRKDLMYFNYLGYTIGDEDIVYSPTPVERFAPRWLNNEQKHNRYLIDNVLMTAFQLGVEQGRRAERSNKIPYHILLRMFQSRGEKIEMFREKLKGYGEDHSVITDSCLDNDDLDLIVPDLEEIEPEVPQTGTTRRSILSTG